MLDEYEKENEGVCEYWGVRSEGYAYGLLGVVVCVVCVYVCMYVCMYLHTYVTCMWMCMCRRMCLCNP